LKKNLVLEKLRAGKPSFGYWVTSGSPIIAEAAAHLGYDFLLLDRQHGHWGFDATVQAMQAIGPTDTMPVARVLRNDPALINQVLDIGALGVIVPLVNSADEAQRAVEAANYPPAGIRSAGGSRLLLYGSDYMQTANDETFVAVMLETRQAVDRAEEILSVPGVDVGFIGPSDLAFSLGVTAFASEEHEAALQKVLQAANNAGKPVGMPLQTPELCLERAAQGFRFLTCGSDMSSLLGDAMARLKALR
jgi:4-hydroxy-2-oxoheptanedioate aldolase